MAPNTIIPERNPASDQAASHRYGNAPGCRQQDTANVTPKRPNGFPLVAAAASVLVHAVVITMLIGTPLPPPARSPEDKVITMRLLPQPALEKRPPAVDVPPPDARNEAEPESRPESEPGPKAAAASASDEITSNDASTLSESPDIEPTGTGTLRATILEQVRALPAETEDEHGPVLPWLSSGAPVPGVPGVRGWIAAYVGAVETSAHNWKENDGSSRGRYVLANGTVICTRRRAPTIDELMNPWKSIAVTMGSICGRQRPEAPDFSDPRVQPPPSVVEKTPANGE